MGQNVFFKPQIGTFGVISTSIEIRFVLNFAQSKTFENKKHVGAIFLVEIILE